MTVRCEALKAENEVPSGQDTQRELEELELKYKKLKVTFIPIFMPLFIFVLFLGVGVPNWVCVCLVGGAWCKLYSFSLLINWIHIL